ncbi:hypothetical protein G6F64_015454 [Rhizopus arrhizus]|uniref:Uncharacterized protein n=1 Tax=Rhizopus oryzae TaxID=64495 RepID=A0A9P7BGZ4_RHIOR|nr:hypothetical protein G6F64_015454 [Rhizopus arrhizus]
MAPPHSSVTRGQGAPCASSLDPSTNSPSVSAHSKAALPSKPCGARAVSGRPRRASTAAKMPMGTLSRNSQCQDPSSRMADAAVGPAANDRPTTIAFRPSPRPSMCEG